MTNKTHIIFDATMLNNLMACPRLCDYRHNLNLVPKEKSNSLEAGTMVHVILEYYHKAIIDGKNRQDAIEIGYIAAKEWLVGAYRPNNVYFGSDDEYASDKFIAQEDSAKYEIGWKYVFQTMNEYFDYWRNDSFTIISAENVDTQTIYEDDELIIGWKAKFDCIIDMSNGMMAVDHKTMKQRKDNCTNNVQFMGQCFLTKSRQMMVNKIGFQSSLKSHEKFERALIPYTDDRLKEFANDIVPHYARMLLAYTEAGNFPPNFSSCETKYGYCEFYRHDVCNSDRRMRDETLKIYFKEGKKWDPTND
jgi:hypothetical protein